MNDYPHPIIAREGWPFLAVAGAVALALTALGRPVAAALAWIVFVFVLQFFRDPAARRAAGASARCSSPADGRVVEVEKARDPYLDRDALKISVFMNVFNVHSNRSPVDGVVRQRLVPRRAASSMRRSTRPRSRTSATRCTSRPRRGAGRHLRADRRADRAAHPLLRRRPATRSRAASATASSASARASTSTCRRTPSPGSRVGDKVRATETILAELPGLTSVRTDSRAMTDFDIQRSARKNRDPPARHLPAAQPVHHRRAVRRLLRHRAGDEPALRAGGGRDLRRHGAGRPRRPRRAPDPDAERVRRRVRQPLRHGVLRRRAGAGRSTNGRCAAWASSAGSPRSSIAPARRCGWRASTPSSTSPTSAGSQGMPSPAAAALVAGFVWIVDDYAIDPATPCAGGRGRSPCSPA